MLLSVVEIIGGIIAGSIALIGDALHNTSDAFSILIAVVAFKIGHRKASGRYTYGFRRAEIIGGFVNLILLFIAGVYLAIEGIG
jgi:cobalt-zinc-cadmium efflux system protein